MVNYTMLRNLEQRERIKYVLIMFFKSRRVQSTISPTMDDREIESIIHYTLRRWLRSPRSPDDARLGARKIVQHLRLCGVQFVGREVEDLHRTH